MPVTITMPKLSPTMTSGMIAKWHKKEGDRVEAGDILLEITTDKATVEHTSLDDGWLRKIIAQEGNEVNVNDPIAILTASQDENISDYRPEAVKAELSTVSPKMAQAARAATSSAAKTQPVKPERVPASPLARKLASYKGVDLSSVAGSGPGGRVLSRDLEGSAAPSVAWSRSAQTPTLESGAADKLVLSPMRKVIARRLQEAKGTIPHFYVRQSVNAEPLVAVRTQLEAGGLKVTYNDFIIRACALALKALPEVNSGFDAETNAIIRFKTVDISIAVSVAEGLITPIIQHADSKNLGELSAEAKALAAKAKEGKLQPKEFQGGSFSISNLGMYGVDDFIAVINPPQAAILAVGAIRDVPVVKGAVVAPGKELSLILSADHRVVDGALAAKFMHKVKHLLENPALLLI